MDKKKAAFKQPSERTNNTLKKEGFVFSFVKPFPEAAEIPLPPEDQEEDPELSEESFESKPNYDQDLEKEFSREEDTVSQGEGTDPPHFYSVVSLCAPKLIPLSLWAICIC